MIGLGGRRAMQTAGWGHHSRICFLLSIVLVGASADQSSLPIQLDRIQHLHACTGTSAYIPWPMNIMEREGHKGTTITLSFRARLARDSLEIASYSVGRQLVSKSIYRRR
ncbi:hypothetical protein ElyMa_004759000 [Elysia marginata]|uniref:Uncharacterized protein n=1 Tax=Elysia marginata TaxID=1093978 RepID=A0AAV4IDY2_9GAST|nr:hypothetical protein ElyMa_004759000 [Elysia marginata]